MVSVSRVRSDTRSTREVAGQRRSLSGSTIGGVPCLPGGRRRGPAWPAAADLRTKHRPTRLCRASGLEGAVRRELGGMYGVIGGDLDCLWLTESPARLSGGLAGRSGESSPAAVHVAMGSGASHGREDSPRNGSRQTTPRVASHFPSRRPVFGGDWFAGSQVQAGRNPWKSHQTRTAIFTVPR